MERQFSGGRQGHLLQGRYDTSIAGTRLNCGIYWARVVNSESESLLTDYTKHTFYELQYVLDGHISMLIRDRRVTIGKADVIVIPPDAFHQVVEADSVGARFIMGFSVSSRDAELAAAIRALDTPTPRRETGCLRRLLELMLDSGCAASDRQVNALLLESFLLELLALSRQPQDETSVSGGAYQTENQKRAALILRHIRACHGVGVSVSALAQRAALSERHLSRIFREETHQTLREAINHEKLRRIEELAASTALSLNEISELCGFSDEYAMNKFFRRFELVNLSEYRRAARP